MEEPKRICIARSASIADFPSGRFVYHVGGKENFPGADLIEYVRADLFEDLIVAARRVVDEGLPEHSWCRCLEDVLEAMGVEVRGMDDFEKYLEEVLKHSKKKEDATNSRFTSHLYWMGSAKTAELILKSYRKYTKERADALKGLVEAAEYAEHVLRVKVRTSVHTMEAVGKLQDALVAMEGGGK